MGHGFYIFLISFFISPDLDLYGMMSSFEINYYNILDWSEGEMEYEGGGGGCGEEYGEREWWGVMEGGGAMKEEGVRRDTCSGYIDISYMLVAHQLNASNTLTRVDAI